MSEIRSSLFSPPICRSPQEWRNEMCSDANYICIRFSLRTRSSFKQYCSNVVEFTASLNLPGPSSSVSMHKSFSNVETPAPDILSFRAVLSSRDHQDHCCFSCFDICSVLGRVDMTNRNHFGQNFSCRAPIRCPPNPELIQLYFIAETEHIAQPKAGGVKAIATVIRFVKWTIAMYKE